MKDKNTKRIKISPDHFPHGKTDWDYLDALDDAQAEALAASDPDALPTNPASLKNFRRAIDVKSLRKRLKLTQAQFAEDFHLSLATLRDWEQARSHPDQAATAFLTVIARQPTVVREALSEN